MDSKMQTHNSSLANMLRARLCKPSTISCVTSSSPVDTDVAGENVGALYEERPSVNSPLVVSGKRPQLVYAKAEAASQGAARS
jgi:hypothetical protein